MLMPLGVYVRQGQNFIRKLRKDPRLHRGLQMAGWVLAGFLLSAASLGHAPMPLVLSALCAGVGGWNAVLLCIGGAGGYLVFWGNAGVPGVIWAGVGMLAALTLGDRQLRVQMPLLLPALAGLVVAFTGLMLRFWGGAMPDLRLYFLRVVMAAGAARVFAALPERREAVSQWLAWGFVMLALAQVPLLPGLSLGMILAGALGAWGAFPAVAAGGLGLDLSGTVGAPMTALLCIAFFLRLIPALPKWALRLLPAGVYLVAAPLCGSCDLAVAAGLGVGGLLSRFLPGQDAVSPRRGNSGVAQVRLELAAGVLTQCCQLLLEHQEVPIDEEALVVKAAQRACMTCSCRKTCIQQEMAPSMPVSLLHRSLLSPMDIPINCRKRGRLLLELRRSQEQLRAIRADRDRQREYRMALTGQYRFLSDFLQGLSNDLPRRANAQGQQFEVEIGVRTAGADHANGDQCLWFPGPGCSYYVIMCDGMGTGMGAREESRVATDMLRRMLCAGYPAQHALKSLNDMLALRGKAGAVTVDLLKIDLSSGKGRIYKWGGAASYLMYRDNTEKIGTVGPPPGLSVTNTAPTEDGLSLRRGQTLVMLSDGVDGEAVARHAAELTAGSSGEVASRVLRFGRGEGQDDATAAVIRLKRRPSST